MDKRQRFRPIAFSLLIALLIISTSGLKVVAAAEVPPLPATYWGTVVTSGGDLIPLGNINAYIEGNKYGSTKIVNGAFDALTVGPPSKTFSGKQVTFKVEVGGIEYPATSIPTFIAWSSGDTSLDDLVIIADPPAPVTVTGISLNQNTLTLAIGGSNAVLIATVTPIDATDKRVTWSSSNTAVATVSNGVVTPMAVGNTVITATTTDGGFSATCAVTVNAAPVAVSGVSVAPASLSLTAGGATGSLTATVSPANASNKSVTWSSSNPAVATVSNGVVTPLTAGTATVSVITADGGFSASCAVTVNPAPIPVSGVSLTPTILNLTAGGATGTLTATVSPANATNKAVTWSSSNQTVATVNNGVVTPLAAGTATVTVTTVDGGKTATCTVNVFNPGEIPVTGVKLSVSTLALSPSATTHLLAQVMPSNAGNRAVTWQSSNPAVASVWWQPTASQIGVVKAGSTIGSCLLTATTVDGGFSAVCTVTVAVPVPAVTLTAGAASAPCGNQVLLTATAGNISSPVYQFWMQSAQDGSWSALNTNYSSGNTLNFSRDVPGIYSVMVYAKGAEAPSGSAVVSSLVQISFTKPHAVSGLSVSGPNGLQTLPVSPTFTANAIDDGGVPLYQFWVHDSSGWKVVKDYSPGNSHTLKNLLPGSYTVAVYALDQEDLQAGRWQAAYYQVFVLNVESRVVLTAPAAAQVGGSVALSAVATGITGCVYQFWYQAPDGSWQQSGAYQSGGQYSFVPTQSGSYRVTVFAKDHYAPATDQFAVSDQKVISCN